MIAVWPGAFLASLGAMADTHARLGESFATNPALGDYATMQTRLVIASMDGRPVRLACGRDFPVDERISAVREARIVFLPSFQAPDPAQALDEARRATAFHDWLRERYGDGALVAACGAGVLHLAAAGLLDGLACSVPSRLRAPMERAFPKVVPAENEPVAIGGRLFTCARDADSPAMVIRLMAQAFSPAVADGLAQRERPAGFAPPVADALVARAQLWIRDHFAGDFRIADLARDLGTSHQALIRRFRAAGEGTPKAYAQRLRIEAAAISLQETDRSVAEIAQLVGYADIPSFRKVFAARMGMPPGAWRRARRERQRKGP
ncbi:MAG: helix-turn-helix domain-containing protein [Novosphingobium sp.]|nr:helix-turn-helix domain-containing protein [Novosphingobium sp.]